MGRNRSITRVCQVCRSQAPLQPGHRSCDACRAETAARREARQLDGLTHREIAELLGMSKTRVQQIERRAIEKLRVGLLEVGYEL